MNRRSLERVFIAVAIICVAAIPVVHAEPSFFQARVAPIFDRHCVGCHGPEKHKAGLWLDSFEHVLRGAESGEVIKPGEVKASELFRRITLPDTDEEAMPGDGKPRLSADEIKILELWIATGASATKPLSEYPTAPVPPRPKAPAVPLVADWRPRAAEIATLEKTLGIRLAPRSQVPTDGLILRTASAPARCDDAALVALAPVASFIVEAELARSRVTDEGLSALGKFENLRVLDLTHTKVSSAGLAALASLKRLEVLNLTGTQVDDAGAAQLKSLPALRRVWLFESKVTAAPVAPTAGSD
ncbi:MAG: c-type cytochrome domain-containing protein [Opitutaceae bacterium]|nr:c-type cytochrome domain-containing protein [Opitutaceae bacterium]